MSFELVIFGGTGDLSWRKLMPALFQAFRHGALPAQGRILGVGLEKMDAEGYREWLREKFEGVELEKRPSAEEFCKFASLLDYMPLDLSDPAGYAELARKVKDRAAKSVVMYLAIGAGLFAPVCRGLAVAGLNGPDCRIVLEKPLGRDAASNKAINAEVARSFGESQIYRIDHYLGKPAVQNLFALRFGNALFEPLWRREHIASVEISISEELGVESRGGFYEQTGALRDMVQNHALQLLCAVAMEPPIDASADAIRDEKLKVLRSLRPWTEASIARDAVRGQYAKGLSKGEQVVGYRQEPGVAPDSQVETFVALRAEVANWRWAGVPFFIRTGKRMARAQAGIVVNFRPAPHAIYEGQSARPNRLAISLQPKDGLELGLMAQATGSRLAPGLAERLAPVSLDLDFEKRFGSDRVGAYEKLLLDVLAGRLNLFVRADEQEAAWNWVGPLMAQWEADANGPRMYAAGGWGPSAASALVARDGCCWSEEA